MREIVKGENNPNYGHKWTDEMKKYLSDKFSDGSRKGENNSRAVKVIRVEDCKIYTTQSEAANDLGLSSCASIERCIKNKQFIANGYHFCAFSESQYTYLSDKKNRFSYLCDCYRLIKNPIIADKTNMKFYNKSEFIKMINQNEKIPTRKIREIINNNVNFTFGNINYQLLVA